ncbi:oligopeptide/dipeptide ABC transporter ATP-binding protein [Streptosporangium sp. V21-05]|uniref:oligopeptide/dipeptide ABC transporter ATP-binding protein n=1 Tax=Streptosporangium sp. V21-05 TaxID=3446115 RepID=UPI003F52A727
MDLSPAPPADRLTSGEPPSPVTPPGGCRFRTRCPAATPRRAAEEPVMRRIGPDQWVACHHPRGATVS